MNKHLLAIIKLPYDDLVDASAALRAEIDRRCVLTKEYKRLFEPRSLDKCGAYRCKPRNVRCSCRHWALDRVR